MSIHRVIREKRRALGLTQEQIAERLGVSAPAVNKWEKGVTCPDLSLLAPLARLLRVDLNELLCFHEELSPQEIGLFCNELAAVFQRDGFDASYKLAQEKLRQYPTCDRLHYSVTTVLEGELLMSGLPQEQKASYETALLGRYEQLAQCGDESLRNNALYMLSGKYLRQGLYDQAQQMADALPERSALDKQILQADILKAQGQPGEAAALVERRVLNAATEMQNLLLRLAELEQAAGNAQAAWAVAGIATQAAGLFALWGCTRYIASLELAAKEKDAQKALPLLRQYMEALFEPWETRTSPLYHRNADKLGASVGESLLPSLLTELETSPEYDFLRGEPDFTALFAEYRANCG